MEKFKKIRDVDGLLSKSEQNLLYDLAKTSNGNIVEIGSWKGMSTICLALGLSDKYNVYAVDPHKNSLEHRRAGIANSFNIFKKNMKKYGLNKKVIPMRMTSEEAFHSWKNGKIGFLWIDGSHNYYDVKFDFEKWSSIIKKNGILVFHDFLILEHWGVSRMILKNVMNKMKFVSITDNTIVFINDGGTSFFYRIKLMMISKYYYIIQRKNKILMFKVLKKIKDMFNFYISMIHSIYRLLLKFHI